MATRLASQDLVLLHGCIGQQFDDPGSLLYYTDYLPSLVASAKGRGRLKCAAGRMAVAVGQRRCSIGLSARAP
jgi:hypothetical protein